ncbi:(6-4)DNA photolyase isoform X2 [Agrilus planipennis]|nr:(6-4)DNA photolyase isoform X2 [Agrilus planipennis]
MEKYLENAQWICKFEKPNTSPNSLEPSTTVLSPYLKFGCLSSRLFYNRLNDVIRGAYCTKPPVSLIGQLLWREFYYTVAAATPNFDKMVGNSICYQIDWDTNERHLQAWKTGKTGYPFIDAIMRQLRTEGWIHHLARHAVACFLTRGDLWISWEEGLKVFEEFLLDADWALNAGNWLWMSASAFFHQFYRVYSPTAFGKKTDKKGDYIRKYVPELRKFPEAYIYEPWLASKNVQKEAGCVVGVDYPERIVIHETVYKINIGRMSAAYKRNKKVNDNGKSAKSSNCSSNLKRKRK